MTEDREAAEKELLRTWAGITLLREIQLAEMRAMAREELKTRRVGPTALAGALGLSSYRLERFLDGAELREHEFNSVAEWCGGKPRPHVSPYLVAIGVLCHWFPARIVRSTRATLWAFVRRLAEAHDAEISRSAMRELDTLYPPDSDIRGRSARHRPG
jgi:hypothetical protein